MLENQRNSLPFWEVHLFILIAVDGNGNTNIGKYYTFYTGVGTSVKD